MKRILLVTLGLMMTSFVFAQKNKKFYDSLGNETSFELHWSQVVGGRYKSVYDKKTNSKTLVRTTDQEFKDELSKTEKRIAKKEKLGTDFPDFTLADLDGKSVDKKDFIGKVVVINFWFAGCTPCEMERPELNGLAKIYQDNEEVAFISFARSNAEQLRSFLVDHPFMFKVIPIGNDEIVNRFGVNDYPITVVINQQGKYIFYAAGTGIGISYLLKKEIDVTLGK